MVINGEEFEVIKPRKYTPIPQRISRWDCLDIYEAYERPSQYKVSIFNEWREWAPFEWKKDGEYFVTDFRITSHNCFAFVLGFNLYERSTGEFIGTGHITRDHNRIYLA